MKKGHFLHYPHDSRMTANYYLSELESLRFINLFIKFLSVVRNIL